MRRLVHRWTRPYVGTTGRQLLAETIASGQWSYGPVSKQVEQILVKNMQSRGAIMTNSGTSALWLLLQQAKLTTKKNAIILPAFGYSAAANIATMLGYKLYIADSLPDSPVVDPESVKRLMDDTVAVVLGINYFGYSADWNDMPVGKDYYTIEDAAGSFGSTYHKKTAGQNAPHAIFSFHTSKAAAAGGEGGAVISEDPQVLRMSQILGRSGHEKGYYNAEFPGMNMLMTDIAASFLYDTLESFNTTLALRAEVVQQLDGIVTKLRLKPVDFNHSSKGRGQNYQTYALVTDHRDMVVDVLRLNGIECRPCWPHLVTEQSAMKSSIKKVDGNLQNAKYFADHILNLPVDPTVTADDIEGIGRILEAALKVNEGTNIHDN